MYYDKVVKTFDSLAKSCASTEEMDRLIQASMVDALLYIADELHEINKNIRAGVDDGR
jgi:hypothetical protein